MPKEIDDVGETLDFLPAVFLSIPLVDHIHGGLNPRLPALVGQKVPIECLALGGRIVRVLGPVENGE